MLRTHFIEAYPAKPHESDGQLMSMVLAPRGKSKWRRGEKVILLGAIDMGTAHVELKLMKGRTTENVKHFIRDRILCRHGARTSCIALALKS